MIKEIQENELSFKRASRPKKGKKVWRCIHDGAQVLAAFETDGETDTIHEVTDFDTLEEMEASIESLALKDDLNEYDPEPTLKLHEQHPRAKHTKRRRERLLEEERWQQRKRDRQAAKDKRVSRLPKTRR